MTLGLLQQVTVITQESAQATYCIALKGLYSDTVEKLFYFSQFVPESMTRMKNLSLNQHRF